MLTPESLRRRARALRSTVAPELLTALGLAAAAAPLAMANEYDDVQQSLEVTATAYNSVEWQTNEEPWVAAWGDSLSNGMKVIAVSRDLLELGLERGTPVRIDGLPGEYIVLDKMNKRWRRKIDVYMGDDVNAARHFGRRDVTIYWEPESGTTALVEMDAAPPAAAPQGHDSLVAEAEPR
jgi:3D (Asp-Asp-Asp) domain-containing protein